MENLISFLLYFKAYLFVVIVCAAVMGIAIFIGIKARKSKNNKEVLLDAEGSEAKE